MPWGKAVKEADPEMIQTLELSDKNFKITIIGILKELQEKVNKVDEQTVLQQVI